MKVFQLSTLDRWCYHWSNFFVHSEIFLITSEIVSSSSLRRMSIWHISVARKKSFSSSLFSPSLHRRSFEKFRLWRKCIKYNKGRKQSHCISADWGWDGSEEKSWSFAMCGQWCDWISSCRKKNFVYNKFSKIRR